MCTIHQYEGDAFRTSIDRTQASVYANDSEAWMQAVASYEPTVLDASPVPGPSSISSMSQTTSYVPHHLPDPAYNTGSGPTIDPAITVAAADYPASRVTTIDHVPPPTLIDSFIPNGFTHSVMPDLPAHPATPTIPCLAPPRGYTIDNATLQHPRPKYIESGYDPITYRRSGGQGMYSRRAQKRVCADSDASEDSAYMSKRQRLPVQDTGKGPSSKPLNYRSIKFDGNSTEPDGNSVSFHGSVSGPYSPKSFQTGIIRLNDGIGADGKPDSGIDPKDERLHCEVCDEYFSRSDALNQHKKTKIHKARKEAKERREELAQKSVGRPTNYAARRRIRTKKNGWFEGCR